MIVLLDTNVVLDVLLGREEFLKDSLDVMTKAVNNGDRMYITASSITDIYYLMRKQTQNKDRAISDIKKLATLFSFAEVNEECIMRAFDSKLNDFEDAVVDSVAKHIKADYIITRNIKDFKRSKTKAITPIQYLQIKSPLCLN